MKKWLVVPIVLLWISAANAQDSPALPANPELEAAITSARDTFKSRDFAAARTQLIKASALAKTPAEMARVMRDMGLIFAQEKQLAAAREQWQKALALKGLETQQQTSLRLDLAKSYVDEKNYSQAINELRPLLEGARDNIKGARAAFAFKPATVESFTIARRELNQVVDTGVTKPNQKVLAWTQLANIALAEKNVSAASDAFLQAVNVKGITPEVKASAHSSVVQSYREAGETRRAKREESYPLAAWLKLAQSYTDNKRWTQARDAFEQALELESLSDLARAGIHIAIANSFKEEGLWAQARQEYEKESVIVDHIQNDPAQELKTLDAANVLYQQSLMSIGQTYIKEKNYASARQTFEKVLTLQPLSEANQSAARENLKQLDAAQNTMK